MKKTFKNLGKGGPKEVVSDMWKKAAKDALSNHGESLNPLLKKFLENTIMQNDSDENKIDLIIKEGIEIEDKFKEECDKWNWNENHLKCKLIILGEAPLSSSKYFYNNIKGSTGNYLSFLKQHYIGAKSLKDEDFKDFLRNKGILNLDIYQYPLPSIIYKKKGMFDSSFFENKIKNLKKLGLITEDTIFVYRYKKLIDRGLPSDIDPILSKVLSKFKHIFDEPIAIGANAANINPSLIYTLPI